VRQRLCQVGLVILLACAKELPAQNTYVVVFGGGSFFRAERSFVLHDAAFQSEIRKGGRLGLRAASYITDHLAFEGGYSFGHHDLRLAEAPVSNHRTFDTVLHQFGAALLYNFGPFDNGLQPFVVVGLGLSRFSPTDQAKVRALSTKFLNGPAQLGASNLFGFGLGGGVEAKLSRRLGLRLDMRDHITGTPRLGLAQRSSGSGEAYYPIAGTIHDIEASIGVVFYLR